MNTTVNYTNSNKATVCSGKNCVTVYGDVARQIEQIALLAAIIIATAAIVKALS